MVTHIMKHPVFLSFSPMQLVLCHVVVVNCLVEYSKESEINDMHFFFFFFNSNVCQFEIQKIP